jgi:hypothetical protein
VVGCVRQAQDWSFVSITAEFNKYCQLEGGLMDAQFIENYKHS